MKSDSIYEHDKDEGQQDVDNIRVRVHFKPEIEVSVPSSYYKAVSEKHFMLMVLQYIHEQMVSKESDWLQVNQNDLEDLRKAYRLFHRKLI